uniref:Uncharacterized protein n=1 Tax=Pristionchus pacificus TaxID=54126 RepID=A0A2A6CP40_PRIPA|eukprot:PDM79823.1 hypothetical protein PRIPAC_32402 [Pristionchus pacificus]
MLAHLSNRYRPLLSSWTVAMIPPSFMQVDLALLKGTPDGVGFLPVSKSLDAATVYTADPSVSIVITVSKREQDHCVPHASLRYDERAGTADDVPGCLKMQNQKIALHHNIFKGELSEAWHYV